MQSRAETVGDTASDRMAPSSERLLRGIQTTLQQLAGRMTDQQSLAELNTIDAALSELASREQRSYQVEYYGAVRQLLVQGFTLLKARLTPDAVAAIDTDLTTLLPAALDAKYGFEMIGSRINRVRRHLSTLVTAARGGAEPALRQFLGDVVARENSFHVQRTQFAQSRRRPAEAAMAITSERLQAYLDSRDPKLGRRITDFKQLVGGYQKVTILFETEDACGRKESLVLRAEKDDRFVELDGTDIRREYELIEFLHHAGTRVAEPLWIENDESKLGNRFIVSRRAAGGNFGSHAAAQGVTDDVARAFVEAIAQIHMLPPSDAMRRLPIGHWLDFPDSQANARGFLDFMCAQPWIKSANPSPILTRLTDWLRDNVPPGDCEQCIIHVDYGPHNVVGENGRITAILDWETARIGDPAHDIAWFLQSCGGRIDYAKAIDWYAEFTGRRLTEYRLRYYDVMGCFMVMVSCASVEGMYEALDDASIVWCDLPLRFTAYSTSTIEAKIAAAEAARGR